MRPEDVSADLTAIATEFLEEDTHEGCDSGRCPGSTVAYNTSLARHLLAAVLPEHERQVREEVAAEIEARINSNPDNGAWRPKAVRGGDLNDASWAAQIARGEA